MSLAAPTAVSARVRGIPDFATMDLGSVQVGIESLSASSSIPIGFVADGSARPWAVTLEVACR